MTNGSNGAPLAHRESLHILLLSHYYWPEQGAPQRRWGELAKRFIDAGHRVTVIAPPAHYPTGRRDAFPGAAKSGAREEGQHGETILRARFREHGDGLAGRSVDQAVTAIDSVVRGARNLRRDRPDVIIATVPGIPSILAGRSLARLLRRPLIIEMRDAWPDLLEPSGILVGRRNGVKALIKRFVHGAVVRAQRRAPAIVTTTEAFAEVLRARGARRVVVVRNGADLFQGPVMATNPGQRELRIAYVGTVGRSQGLETAVRAAALLKNDGVELTLRIVGPGACRAELAKLATELKAPVDLRGPVPRSEVRAHLEWADSQLISLKAWRPFEWTVPSKLYEALAAGRHITAVVAGESAQIVTATGAGHVVEPGDDKKLANLWRTLATERAQLAVNGSGRAWVQKNCDFDRLAGIYLRLLTDISSLQQSGRKRRHGVRR